MAEKKKHKVTVYSTSWCPWCKRAKEFLKENKVEFDDRDIEANKEWADELVAKSGQTGIPVIDVDGQVIVGFDEDALRKALGLKP